MDGKGKGVFFTEANEENEVTKVTRRFHRLH
jgi:hypothetical protein